MTQQLIPQSSVLTRRQSLIQTRNPPSAAATTAKVAVTSGQRIAETAGRATADCTAVCCCCPCTVMNIVVLAVYKVPAGICRRVKSKHRQRRVVATRRRNGILTQRPAADAGGGPTKVDGDGEDSSVVDLLRKENSSVESSDSKEEEEEDENDVDKLEKEMWDWFHGAGFWRSFSQRET